MKRNKSDRITERAAYGYVRRSAVDKKNGMTLDEIAEFVTAAQQQGIYGGTKVEIVATWRSSARNMTVRGTVEM